MSESRSSSPSKSAPPRTIDQKGIEKRGDAACPSLYAYAKALELRDEWDDVRAADGAPEATQQLASFERQLESMGWHPGNASATFLNNYRAAALAQAEGK